MNPANNSSCRVFTVIASGLLSLAILIPRAARGDEPVVSDEKPYVDQHYPDFGFLPPPTKYKGRVFWLSQHYPKTVPNESEKPEFLKIDFTDKAHWRDYLVAAQDYCFKENVLGGDVENDFDAATRENPTWFHVPWQHATPKGREGVHGLTKEAEVAPRQLAVGQTYAGGQFYAVGLYNKFGGYTIGKVWADKKHPNPKGILFPPGTVVMKVLFTDVPTDQVPSLVNPVLWNAFVTDNFASTKRGFKKLALVQMDLMVRDERSPCGWVFGTYQYNGNMNEKNKWKNLRPLGVQWGNDPKINDRTAGEFTNPVAVVTRPNPHLTETIINPDDKELPPAHLGWNGRLNGPADNSLSSCMSCHMTAQAPAKSPMSPLFFPDERDRPKVGDDVWMHWFQNVKAGERFDKGKPTSSTDFSLQLAASLQNFYNWEDVRNKMVADRYKQNQKKNEDPEVEYPVTRSAEP